MAQCIVIAFFCLAAVSLAILGYATGYYDAIERKEHENDIEEDEEIIDFNRIRPGARANKRIDYNLRELWK